MLFHYFFCLAVVCSGAVKRKVKRSAKVPRITVAATELRVDDQPFHMKGACWDGTGPAEAARDSEEMVNSGINTILPEEPILDKAVLDAFWQQGLRVLSPLKVGVSLDEASAMISSVKQHPAILMWTVVSDLDSEVSGPSFQQARDRVAALVSLAKRTDRFHPVSVALGGLPDARTMESLEQVDMWGVNVCADGKLFREATSDA